MQKGRRGWQIGGAKITEPKDDQARGRLRRKGTPVRGMRVTPFSAAMRSVRHRGRTLAKHSGGSEVMGSNETAPLSLLPYGKPGFANLVKRAHAHQAGKREVGRQLRPLSAVCGTFVQNCVAHKALRTAIGEDTRPLASRHAGRLIAAGQSPAAV